MLVASSLFWIFFFDVLVSLLEATSFFDCTFSCLELFSVETVSVVGSSLPGSVSLASAFFSSGAFSSIILVAIVSDFSSVLTAVLISALVTLVSVFVSKV